jgi:hypothetical protein
MNWKKIGTGIGEFIIDAIGLRSNFLRASANTFFFDFPIQSYIMLGYYSNG